MSEIKALFQERLDRLKVRCNLCSHRCILNDGQTGICGTRKNRAGDLYVLTYGNIIAENVDPVEKKPLYHFIPGTRTFSIASPGCNFRCSFCQNWRISQIGENQLIPHEYLNEYEPATIVAGAKRHLCKTIAYTYSEPTVFYEYMINVSKTALDESLKNVVVSNGYMSADCVAELNDYIHGYNIDLKSFSDRFYRKNCGGRLQPVLDNIIAISLNNNWLEITTLIIPGENDSREELNDIAEFIAGVSKDIPWHISRFFPNYLFKKLSPTEITVLQEAREIGFKNGLKYIYLGNAGLESSTNCPSCGLKLINRIGFNVLTNVLGKSSECPECGERIAGVWK